ncbi:MULTISPECIES: carbohydrate ABC transporter permease [Agromyces]|uniref:Sugar ABC transporter permease n=1 Tax=Agromyces mediolanus TaxID=41986 RepID=A0A918CCW5_AGRME|nr:carbohydrate ABC transporter permease [Agromyces mediolanus]GGR15964.1 sugar ABC transporter permease [Agromyces mediolanus]GLJ73571.1 sugar ABC transporter permease [Agromyces mediolanus]GLU89209.1 sugar ABC transporter permease [Agromyces sp. NBRC 114283]
MSAAVTPTTRAVTAPGSLDRARRGGGRRRVTTWLLSALSVVLFALFVFPVYWMVNTSFQPNNDVRGSEVHFFPDNFTLRNYETVIFDPGRTPFLPAAANSLIVTLLTVIIALVFAFLASVAVTRFRFKSRRAFILTILVIQMIPGEAMIVSVFRVIDGWQLLNTIAGLTIVYIATVLPFTIWTLRGFVNGVPVELEEAAMIDGCSRAGAFWRVTFPLLAPGLIATGVFGFIQAWNEFIMALVLNARPEMMTLPVWLRTFLVANGTTNWAGIMAGSTLMAIPVIVFFLIVQGRMTSGLVSGAVKG